MYANLIALTKFCIQFFEYSKIFIIPVIVKQMTDFRDVSPHVSRQKKTKAKHDV